MARATPCAWETPQHHCYDITPADEQPPSGQNTWHVVCVFASGALTPPKITPRVRASSPGLDEVTGVPLSLGLSVAPHHVSSGPGATNPPHSVPPGVAAMSSVTKAVQLTATVNSVPVAGPSRSPWPG